MLEYSILADAAGGDPNVVVQIIGWSCIGFVVWLIYVACKPKGYDVNHVSVGKTTVRPK